MNVEAHFLIHEYLENFSGAGNRNINVKMKKKKNSQKQNQTVNNKARKNFKIIS